VGKAYDKALADRAEEIAVAKASAEEKFAKAQWGVSLRKVGRPPKQEYPR
jgi:hypothetical protein